MKSPRLAGAGVASVMLILVLSFSQAAEAATFVGEPIDWGFVGTPTVTSLGASQAAEATFDNNLNVPVLGIVIMVLHNSLGQTVYYSTATVNITPASSGTVYTPVSGVSPGMYNATIFAFSTGGLAISNSTTFAFSVR